jgi:hypothetical protein
MVGPHQPGFHPCVQIGHAIYQPPHPQPHKGWTRAIFPVTLQGPCADLQKFRGIPASRRRVRENSHGNRSWCENAARTLVPITMFDAPGHEPGIRRIRHARRLQPDQAIVDLSRSVDARRDNALAWGWFRHWFLGW